MRTAALMFCLLVACAPGTCDPSGDEVAQPTTRSAATSGPEATQSSGSVTRQTADVGQVVLMVPGQEPVTVPVEIVHTPAARERGLMFRQSLPSKAGMLFLFDKEHQQTFWMRNTYIPLDMIFIRADLSVLGVVENAEPRTDDPRGVPGASRYVLEVNAGFARKHGISAGTMVRFEGMDALLAGR